MESKQTVEPLGNEQDTAQKLFPHNRYATKKTLAQGLLDVGLIMANASQLKSLISAGSNNQDFYVPLLVLIGLSIALQIVVGVILLILGTKNAKTPEEQQQVNSLNNASVALIFLVTVFNIFIAAFGIKLSESAS